ncbi:MAG: thioredoxin [Acidimicrobiia bacterium]|nr:thioredoxin [Acidimicrobiia bacterium]
MATVSEVKEQDFNEQVLLADGKVVVDFWAPWCGPCKAVAPEIQKLADKHGNVTFVKVNVDEAPSVAGRYNIMGIPTIGMFESGQLVKTAVGAMPAERLESELGLT